MLFKPLATLADLGVDCEQLMCGLEGQCTLPLHKALLYMDDMSNLKPKHIPLLACVSKGTRALIDKGRLGEKIWRAYLGGLPPTAPFNFAMHLACVRFDLYLPSASEETQELRRVFYRRGRAWALMDQYGIDLAVDFCGKTDQVQHRFETIFNCPRSTLELKDRMYRFRRWKKQVRSAGDEVRFIPPENLSTIFCMEFLCEWDAICETIRKNVRAAALHGLEPSHCFLYSTWSDPCAFRQAEIYPNAIPNQRWLEDRIKQLEATGLVSKQHPQQQTLLSELLEENPLPVTGSFRPSLPPLASLPRIVDPFTGCYSEPVETFLKVGKDGDRAVNTQIYIRELYRSHQDLYFAIFNRIVKNPASKFHDKFSHGRVIVKIHKLYSALKAGDGRPGRVPWDYSLNCLSLARPKP